MKKLIVLLSLILFPLISEGSILYTNNFASSSDEPPINWTQYYNDGTSSKFDCNETDSWGDFQKEHATSGNYTSIWGYNKGTTWTNYTFSFKFIAGYNPADETILVLVRYDGLTSIGGYGFTFYINKGVYYVVAVNSDMSESAKYTIVPGATMTVTVQDTYFGVSFSLKQGNNVILTGLDSSSTYTSGTIAMGLITGAVLDTHVVLVDDFIVTDLSSMIKRKHIPFGSGYRWIKSIYNLGE